MSISPDLFMAILAMDSYNRGYNAGVNITGNQIGNATLSFYDLPIGYEAASFFAQAYTLADGRTVISYRGTDVLPGVTDPFFNAASWQRVGWVERSETHREGCVRTV